MHLEPGAAVSASLRLSPQPLHRVTGRITPVPRTSAKASLINVLAVSEYGGWSYLQTAPRDDGAIDLVVPDGRYKTDVRDADISADATVEVAGKDVGGVSIHLGSRVGVPVRFDVVKPAALELMTGFSAVQQATFGFQLMFAGDPAGGQSFGTGTGIVDSAQHSFQDGTSTFGPQVPGPYLLVTEDQPPWYVASITSNGHNLAVEPYMITDQEHATPIEIQLRADGASVSGVVRRGAAPAAAFIYALPTFPSTSALRWTTAHADGVYRLEALAPGSYRILTFDRDVAIPFREDISPWLARGRAIAVAAGGKAELNLEIEP